MIRKTAAMLLMVAVAYFGVTVYQTNYSKKNVLPIIRLHIIANSNEDADQKVKYEIRNAIISYLTPKFKDVKNLNEARRIVDEEQGAFKEIAEKLLKNKNKTYNVNTYHGYFQFPPRNYGAVFLPAGEYEALRIVLGNGAGRNWWCVLFPPLCLIKESGYDITKVVALGQKPKIIVRSKLWEILRAK